MPLDAMCDMYLGWLRASLVSGNCAANSLLWWWFSLVAAGMLVPTVPVADAKGSVMLVLPLVVVSTGRKMVPISCVSADLSGAAALQGL